jgi:ribosomal protein L37E
MDGPWANHRRRAEALSARFPFAAEMLTLYLALTDVWDGQAERILAERPRPGDLPQWTVDRVLPDVAKATEAAGPVGLVDAVQARLAEGDLVAPLAAWLRGEEPDPVERYLARAALTPALAVLDPGPACADDPSPRGERRCPHCGGMPQVSYRSDAGDGLVTGRRHLVCVRCGRSWAYSASACAGCGEDTGSQRTVYAERSAGPVVGRGDREAGPATFPHLRVEACTSCQRYLIDVDLGRDPRAVAEVDELAALPLDLYATERGHTKLAPNLMGV